MTKYTDYFPKPYSVLVTNSDTEEEVKALLKKKALGEQDKREIENLLDFKQRLRLHRQKRGWQGSGLGNALTERGFEYHQLHLQAST